MNIQHLIQIIFTIIVVCTIAVTFVIVIKRNDKTTYKVQGMVEGFLIGSILGIYYLNALILAPIGMFLGLIIGKSKKVKINKNLK